MQALEINLATRPFRNNTLLWLAHLLAVGALGAFTAWTAMQSLRVGRELTELRSKVEGIDRRMVELDIREQRAEAGTKKHDLRSIGVQAATANQVILRKALSWTRLFNLLETVVPYETKMVAIRPTFEVGGGAPESDDVFRAGVPVTIEGTAQSIEAFFELERSLMVDAHFDAIEPDSLVMADGGEVNFELKFLYFPEGRPETTAPVEIPHFLPAAAEDSVGEEVAGETTEEEAPTQTVAAPGRAPGSPPAATATASPPAAPPAASPEPPSDDQPLEGYEPTEEEKRKAREWKPRLRDESKDPPRPPARKGMR